ncbi:MAG: hypothetical protein DRP66_00070 [Planctomycetota bacterium]|nr:MAG: hypothetical protein DRP66_00070 [Planctomycetota bacterium]
MAKKVKKAVKKKKSPQKKATGKVSKKKAAKKAVTKKKKAAGKTAKRAAAKKTQGAKPKARRRKLTPVEIEGYRRLLLEKWAELLGDVNHIEEEALRKSRLDAAGDLSSMPIHMADLGSDNFEQEFALGLMDSERKILNEIRAALQRIDQGTFGICEGTGKPIAKARLNANPWARYCIDYARMVEEGLILEGEKVPAEEQEDEAGVEDYQENWDDTEYEAQDDDDDELLEEQPDDEDEDA